MTFLGTQRSTQSCRAAFYAGNVIVDPAVRRAGDATARSSRFSPFPIAALLLIAACTPTTYSITRDPPDYVDHVIEDVTAIVEGMAAAHARDRVVFRDPGIRSSQ